MTGQGQRQVGLLDLALLLWAQIVNGTVDLVHGRVLRVVLRIQKALNATVSSELLPIVHLLEDVIHRHGDLPS